MNTKELRIGNLVTDEFYETFKTIHTVESINSEGINLLIEDDGNWSELAKNWIAPEYKFEDLRGIPLTAELLERAGFEVYDNGMGTTIMNGYGMHFRFYDNDLEEIDLIQDQIQLDTELCEYVHQLQNLYHAFTGEELTLKEKDQ